LKLKASTTQESMTEKSKNQRLRRLAHRAGLRIATLATDAGRVFAVIDGARVVALCVGHQQAIKQLATAAGA
jgi:archaeosine-15-forming tRNA-guanine transglycosylase